MFKTIKYWIAIFWKIIIIDKIRIIYIVIVTKSQCTELELVKYKTKIYTESINKINYIWALLLISYYYSVNYN